jgi:hypothetical protein
MMWTNKLEKNYLRNYNNIKGIRTQYSMDLIMHDLTDEGAIKLQVKADQP